MSHISALLIRGLSYAGSSYPTLFVDNDAIDVTTIPAGLGLANAVVVGRLLPAGISGGASSADPRNPLVNATSLTARLQDDAAGTLSALFSADPGNLTGRQWSLLSASLLDSSETSLTLSGRFAPNDGDVLYLGAEAVAVNGASSAVTTNTYLVSVVRAACGSYARTWALDPSAYPAGDDGSQESLTLYSRQPYESGKIEASIYQFKMSDSSPGTVESCEWAWHGTVEGRPKQDKDFVWSVVVAHASKSLAEFTVPGGKDLELAHCVTVVTPVTQGGVNAGGTNLFGRTLPKAVKFHLTRYEAERLFNEPLHLPHNPAADATLVSTLAAKAGPSAQIERQIAATVGGYEWVWRITAMSRISADHVEVRGTLVASQPGASINDQPFRVNNSSLGGTRGSTNAGFFETIAITTQSGPVFQLPADDRVRVEDGETAPKISLRYRVRATFPEALLYALTSGHGGFNNDATYDTLVGGWPQLPADWVNKGATPADPLAVDEGTQAILELSSLLSEKYDYYFMPGAKLGDWLKNELLLHCALFAFVPSTGALAPRIWARSRTSETELNPIVWPDGEVEPGETMRPLRALFLERGIDPVTLEPRFRKPLQLPETRAADYKDAVTVRIWKDGGAFSDQELGSGPLARLERALFSVTLGEPAVYKIPLDVSSGVQFGDLVVWTDPAIPTASGRGVSSLPLIVVGVDRHFGEGRLIASCLWDVVNSVISGNGTSSVGTVAPRLKIVGVTKVATGQYTLVVESVASDTSFAIDSSHGAIFAHVADDGSRLRVINPLLHNPSTERTGYAEMSATVTSVTYDSAAHTSTLSITVDASWDRGSLTRDLIAVVGAYVVLHDFQPAANNPEGVVLQGNSRQGYSESDGIDFAQYSGTGHRLKFDGRRSLIAS